MPKIEELDVKEREHQHNHGKSLAAILQEEKDKKREELRDRKSHSNLHVEFRIWKYKKRSIF